MGIFLCISLLNLGTKNIPIWEEYMMDFAGRENLNFLEVGSWEGRSACWLLENILTGKGSMLTCVDTFGGCAFHDLDDMVSEVERTFDSNIAAIGAQDKVTKVKGVSQYVLRKLPISSYDLIYIDASHLAPNVLMDIMLCWELLKVQGILVLDDYLWKSPEHNGDPLREPKIAIDAALSIFANHIDLIYKGRQVIIRKKSGCSTT